MRLGPSGTLPNLAPRQKNHAGRRSARDRAAEPRTSQGAGSGAGCTSASRLDRRGLSVVCFTALGQRVSGPASLDAPARAAGAHSASGRGAQARHPRAGRGSDGRRGRAVRRGQPWFGSSTAVTARSKHAPRHSPMVRSSSSSTAPLAMTAPWRGSTRPTRHSSAIAPAWPCHARSKSAKTRSPSHS